MCVEHVSGFGIMASGFGNCRAQGHNVGAFIIRIGSWGPIIFYCSIMHPNPVLILKAPTLPTISCALITNAGAIHETRPPPSVDEQCDKEMWPSGRGKRITPTSDPCRLAFKSTVHQNGPSNLKQQQPPPQQHHQHSTTITTNNTTAVATTTTTTTKEQQQRRRRRQ